MKIKLSSNGRIVLPAELRKKDRLQAGEEFRIERVCAGKYVITRIPRVASGGLLKWLQSCPVKDWYQPLASESTDQL